MEKWKNSEKDLIGKFNGINLLFSFVIDHQYKCYFKT